MIEIQTGVPMPSAMKLAGDKRRKYPWSDMAIGGMFFVPDRMKNTLSVRASVMGRKLGLKFRTRLLSMEKSTGAWKECPPGGLGAVCGIGVWRIA
jgi:hypothetical protein